MKDISPTYQAIRAGFTLLELLVTMAISSVILLALAALVTQSTGNYALSQRSVNHLSQARAFFQLFQSEISNRLPDSPLILRSSLTSEPKVIDQIAFVRTLTNHEQNPDTPGDLATSCYYVAFVGDSDQRMNPKLFRKTLNPTETQSLIEGVDEAEFPEVDPSMDESVIDSVLSFKVTPMYFNRTSGSDEPWDKAITNSPSYIELNIRTVDESLSVRLTDRSAWKRLAVIPKEAERQYIREVSYKLSIGK